MADNAAHTTQALYVIKVRSYFSISVRGIINCLYVKEELFVDK